MQLGKLMSFKKKIKEIHQKFLLEIDVQSEALEFSDICKKVVFFQNLDFCIGNPINSKFDGF